MRQRAALDNFDTPDDLEMLVEQALMSAVESAVDTGFACARIDEALARIRGTP